MNELLLPEGRVLKATDVLCFGDLQDVLRNTVNRTKDKGGTIVYTYKLGAHFCPGPYKAHLVGKRTVVLCLATVDPAKVFEYLMRSDCSDFRDPRLINRYDWKHAIYDEDETAFLARTEDRGVVVRPSVSSRLRECLGDEYYKWTYVCSGDGDLSRIPGNELDLVCVYSNERGKRARSPGLKRVFLLKRYDKNRIFGIAFKSESASGYEYGALLEDGRKEKCFALIVGDEHIDNMERIKRSKGISSREDLSKHLARFNGLVRIKNFR